MPEAAAPAKKTGKKIIKKKIVKKDPASPTPAAEVPAQIRVSEAAKTLDKIEKGEESPSALKKHEVENDGSADANGRAVEEAPAPTGPTEKEKELEQVRVCSNLIHFDFPSR